MQVGIAPFLKKQMIRDFRLQPLSFKFDETTTSQVKKQHGYIQFWFWEKKEKLSTSCYASTKCQIVVNNTSCC